MSALQLLGHIFQTARVFIGLSRELTVDITNWNLKLHDGVTIGGRTILNRDNADQRYQAKAEELDGFTGFEPQQKGFLVRLGAADYRIRTLTVNAGNLKVTNPQGYAGNPLLELAETITTNHTWSGSHTFDESIVAAGGVEGNVIGNITGDIVGNVTGNLTGNVTGDLVGNTTGLHTGSLDLTDGDVIWGAEQVTLASLTPEVISFMLAAGAPVGGVIMWYGDINDIPDPWLLCDGSNGTPDLRDRFVVGAGNAYDPDDIGGSANHTPVIEMEPAGAHTHILVIDGHELTIDEIPAHNHGGGITDDNVDSLFNHGTIPALPSGGNIRTTGGGGGNLEGLTTTVGGSEEHTHTGTASSNGSHTHTFEATQVDHRPPYYALAYIMKGS